MSDRPRSHFSDRALAGFDRIALLVMAAVRRDHTMHDASLRAPDETKQQRIVALEERLALHAPGLTGRERAVCARLSIGMLYEGVAADLGISVASVKTYRKRAFERLDIHFRNELYDVALGRARPRGAAESA